MPTRALPAALLAVALVLAIALGASRYMLLGVVAAFMLYATALVRRDMARRAAVVPVRRPRARRPRPG